MNIAIFRKRRLSVVLAVLVVWCSTASAENSSPTFNKEIAPIVFDRCVTCHRPGQIGPFSLWTYEDVKKRAKQIVRVVEDRTMPPWMPHPEWGDFKDARTLNDRQIETLRAWLDNGSPEGDPTDLPPRPKFRDGWQLGKPDMILKMPKPFTVPAEGRDVYVHFVFPLQFDRDRYLRGIEVIPGNRRVAHHAAGLLDTSGKAQKRAAKGDGVSYGGNDPGFLPAGFTPGFVPGQIPGFFADGEAITLKKGTDFVLQMHYHPTGREETDQTMIGLHFTDEKPKRGPSIFLLGSLDIDIPPGEKAYRRADAFRLPVDYEVRNIWAHMHLIGRETKVWAELPDKSIRRLLWVDQWNFNWQDTYTFAKPFILPAGSIVNAEFQWDNSADNLSNPFNPPQRIVEGEQSTNEMGGIIIGGLPIQQEEEWKHWLGVGAHYLRMEAKKRK